MGKRRLKRIWINEQLCPVCNRAKYSTYKLGLLQCVSCGLVLSPAIWKPRVNEQMEEEWFGDDFQPETSFWVTLFEEWNNRRTFSRLAQANPQGHRLLEIGVGSGSLLAEARERGYEVMGCDISAQISRRVAEVYGIPMHGEPLASLVVKGCFDVIVMNHVLEHVQQPVKFLQNVYSLLAPSGVVYIAVPNIACWESVLSGWTSYEPYHLAYFDPQTLVRTVTMGGLIPEQITTHDSFSGGFLALLRTALGVNRMEGAVTRSVTRAAGYTRAHRWVLVKHVYRFTLVCVGVVMWPLRWLQARLGYGDEAICIARKS